MQMAKCQLSIETFMCIQLRRDTLIRSYLAAQAMWLLEIRIKIQSPCCDSIKRTPIRKCLTFRLRILDPLGRVYIMPCLSTWLISSSRTETIKTRMERSSQHLETSPLLVQRREIPLQLPESCFKRSTMSICQILTIEPKRLEERRSRIIRQNCKKERHGSQCITEVNLLIRLKKHMEQSWNFLKRKSQENHNLRSNTPNLSNPRIRSRKVKQV